MLFRQEVYKKICREVATKLDMPVKDVDYIYHQYWQTVKDEFSSIPIRDFKDPSEIENYFQSFSIMHIGKFYTNKWIIHKAKQLWARKKAQEKEQS